MLSNRNAFNPHGIWSAVYDFNCQQYRMIVQIVTAVFQDGNKWRLSDGERTFNAAILDGDFLMLVNKGERFGKGERLDIGMQIIQNGFGMKTSIERSILKVHRRLTPQEQTGLF